MNVSSNDHTPLVQYLSWDHVESLSKELGEKIKKSGFEPDILIGIAVGGLVPLTLLAREIGVRNVTTITARSYIEQEQKEITITHLPKVELLGKKVLLVDEIADSGKTQKMISAMLMKDFHLSEIKTATLVVNTAHCVALPDYSVLETTDWVQFPWEEPLRSGNEDLEKLL